MKNLVLHKTITNNRYRKSNIKVKGVDAVYIYDREIIYAKREYETLTDSSGRTHSVQVGCKMVDIKLDDSQFEIFEAEDREYLNHKFLSIDKMWTFQYGLKLYYMVGGYESCYNYVGYILQQYERNHKEIIRTREHWRLDKLKYFPLFETCFTSGNNMFIERLVPDNLFFRIADKDKIEVAMNRLNYKCQSKLIKDGYLQMDDVRRLKYLNHRLINKIDYIKKYDYLFKTKNYETSKH